MMTSAYVNLFKALPVEERTNSFSADYIKYGVMVEASVVAAYPESQVDGFVNALVPSDSQMNKTFRKSWKKVRDASMEDLVIEQFLHYFTTYGFDALGCYNKETVFLPNEKLSLDGNGGITFYVLRGITRAEVRDAVQRMISSGLALSDSDLNDLVSVIKDQKMSIDPAASNNREITVRLYNLLKVVPKDPVDYLRLQVYRATNSTMLIKSRYVTKAISDAVSEDVFAAYGDIYGLVGLASIFYRFKPLFLAFKNDNSASTVNRIRRMAVKYHRPMSEDYLASVTKRLRNGTFDLKKLRGSLNKVNLFRKVKLAQALRFYNNEDASGVVYFVRNGKSFTTTVNPLGASADEAISATMDSLFEDLTHLQGKSVYLDADLSVPTSGKMFCGDIPFGSSFSTEESLMLGVSWKDLPGLRVDLDLSMIAIGGKTGWDSDYRNEDFLWSGDITAAPKGATEGILIRAGIRDGTYLLNLNYYNAYEGGAEVPFTLFVTKENEFERMDKSAMMSQDNMLFWANSAIDAKRKQKSIGVLKVKDGLKTFYVFESKMGRGVSACSNEKTKNMIAYYDKYLDAQLALRPLLGRAGAKLVDSPKGADFDLSLNSLTKDTLIKLLTKEK